jgi:hypothetical protein
MKKLLTIATLLMFIALGNVSAQDKYMFSGVYRLDFSDQVRIKVDGASQEKSTKEWNSGGKVGNHEIDAATFAKLQDATSGEFKIEIETKSIGTLHKVQFTDAKTGNVINGIFDAKKNEFTVGSSKGQTAANGASKTEIGIIKGTLSADKSTITEGTFDVGFIAGKAPAVISASATFTFTGKLMEEK